MEEIYKLGIGLIEEQIIVRDKNRGVSKKASADLLNVHCLCLGIIKSIYSQFLNVPGKTNESISARLPLISSFIQGIDLCEIAINEGLYTQAATLIKQELETVAAINECCRNNRKNKKTPNTQFVKFGLNKEYGFLNGIGHVSDKELFEILFKTTPNPNAAGQIPVSITPVFDNELCVRLYAIHILLIVQIIEQLNELFSEMYLFEMPDKLKEALGIIYTVLHKEKWLIDSSELT